MPNLTREERVERIAALVAEVRDNRHETVRIPWRAGEPEILDVIAVDIDDVLLNPNSHRLRAQLQGDPEWEHASADPFTPDAQRIIQRHVRAARSDEQFAALKESLAREGQTDPGVMTHEGLLINANTRVVALRELDNPDRRHLRVGVLPETASGSELALVELRLQMQQDLKVPYTMTNMLLFIDELSAERGLSPAQIAKELRIHPESPRRGTTEVRLRLQLLDLLRTLQKIPSIPLPLTFFEDIELQHLKDLVSAYSALVDLKPDRARRLLEAFLLSLAVDVTAVHQVRQIDADFMDAYMLPAFVEDAVLGPMAKAIAVPPVSERRKMPAGVDTLLGQTGVKPEPEGRVDARRLVDFVRAPDERLTIPGAPEPVDRDDLKGALGKAVRDGIALKQAEKREDDVLGAPASAVKRAAQQLVRAKDALAAVVEEPDFDAERRDTLEEAFYRLEQAEGDLREALIDADVISD